METASLYESIRPRYPELAGQVAVVTGSSRGIGKGIALRLAREGMKVVINSRTPEAVEATTAELRELGAEVLAVPADVGHTKDVNRLFAETLRAYGTVDLLVNNAAILRRHHFFEVPESLLDDELVTNIKGPYMCSYRAAQMMSESDGGNIIHISSVGGLRAHWRGLPYDVTKGAIDAMTRAMALELAAFDIRVNAIAPGATRTERWNSRRMLSIRAVGIRKHPSGHDRADKADRPGRLHPFVQRIPLGRIGDPLDIGAAVAFLASPDASYITGQVIYVDGGITAQLSPRAEPV